MDRIGSPVAATVLLSLVELAPQAVDNALGETDCEFGCEVEPDGRCPHGYESAALTAGLI